MDRVGERVRARARAIVGVGEGKGSCGLDGEDDSIEDDKYEYSRFGPAGEGGHVSATTAHKRKKDRKKKSRTFIRNIYKSPEKLARAPHASRKRAIKRIE